MLPTHIEKENKWADRYNAIQENIFWYSLAICTIGGMIASVVVQVLVLSVFFRVGGK